MHGVLYIQVEITEKTKQTNKRNRRSHTILQTQML